MRNSLVFLYDIDIELLSLVLIFYYLFKNKVPIYEINESHDEAVNNLNNTIGIEGINVTLKNSFHAYY